MARYLRLILAVLLIVLLKPFCFAVRAADVLEEEARILRTESLYEGLEKEELDLMDGLSPTRQVSFGEELYRIIYSVFSGSSSAIRQSVSAMASLLAAVLLCTTAQSAEQKHTAAVSNLAGTLAVFLICMRTFGGLIGQSLQTVHKISEYSKLLLPTLSSAAIASGAISSGSALYAGSMLFISVLNGLMQHILSPMVYAYCALSAAECAASAGNLTGLRKFAGQVISVSLKAVMYCFTGYLTLTGILSGAADDLRLKAAKAAISGALPVVGSIVSDASGSVIAGAGILKNTVGVFGMLAVLAIGLTPFVRAGIGYLMLKLTAAISAVFSESALSKMISCMASALGFVLSMTGCAVLMTMVSVCCFMKVVGG